MNEITLNPDGSAIRHFIGRAVHENVETPVRHAFEDGWPVTLTQLEADEVAQAVRDTNPKPMNPHGTEHKQRALRAVHRSKHS